MEKSRLICNICNIEDSSPVIHCSVCCNAFHYKCVFPGVPSSVYDHLVDMVGIYWYCPADRALSVPKLLDRISLISTGRFSVESKPNTVTRQIQTSPLQSPVRMILRAKRPAPTVENVSKKRQKKAPTSSTKSSTTSHQSTPTTSATATSKIPASTFHSPTTSSMSAPASQPSTLDPAIEDTPRQEKVAVTPKPILKPAVLPSSAHVSVVNEDPVDNLLTVVPPNRSVFLSRLEKHTSVENVKLYIQQKFNISTGFGVRKFDAQSSTFSSFLIRCDDTIFETFLDSKAWPKNMKVSEFFHRRTRRKPQS